MSSSERERYRRRSKLWRWERNERGSRICGSPQTSCHTADAYLGISASPNNPIGAFLPSTQALDPGATGFFVYRVSFPSVTLQDASNPNVSPFENISSQIPLASYILGFLDEGGGNVVATADSGAIFETGGRTVPEPSSVLLLGSGLLTLLAGLTRRLR